MQKRVLFILASVFFFSIAAKSQTLSLDEVISAPAKESDHVDELLLGKKWEKYNYEVHSDSGFVKHI